MMKFIRNLLLIIALLAVILVVYRFRGSIFSPRVQVEQSSEVMLERLEKVNKLVTLDVYLSELYKHNENTMRDFGLLSKSALVRVKAKVSVGYDFNRMQFGVDETNRTLTLQGFPSPEILAIDHDLDYYDIYEGIFTSFTEQDYNNINKKAKEMIREAAMKNEIFSEAEAQKDELINMFRWMLQASGWQLVIYELPNVETPDTAVKG